MSSILNVSRNVTQPPAPSPVPPKAAATAVAPQLTLSQLVEEPLSELQQQARAGNALAIQLLAQDQATAKLETPQAATASPGFGTINLYA